MYGGLRVVDVSDPTVPAEVGFWATPVSATDVVVAGRYAYVANAGHGLRVVDVSDQDNPSEAGFYDTPGEALGVAVDRECVYLANGFEGLYILRWYPSRLYLPLVMLMPS